MRQYNKSETQKYKLDDYFGMASQKLTNKANIATKQLNEAYGSMELNA